MTSAQGLLGVVVLIGVGFALCSAKRAVNWRLIGLALALQVALAFLVLKFAPVVAVVDAIAAATARVISFADAGASFLFGKAADASQPWGFVFAFKVLPVIIFFASLMAVLYHLGVMQRIVAAIAWVLRRSLGITGAEALCASANIFFGQTEAPLTIRPYIAKMTRSQLMAVMTGGFATIAGSVLAAYVGMLGNAYAQALGVPPEQGAELFAKHLLTASVMSAPAGIMFAKLMLPETEAPAPESVNALLANDRATANVVDAAAAGASDGLRLALNVAAMLVAFVALLALVNWPLTALDRIDLVRQIRGQMGLDALTLQSLLGWLLTPVAWLMGVAWTDCRAFGSLLGQQVIATEFVAYADLARLTAESKVDARTAQIATYALCGFANVASIGIQIGGLSALAPERRADLAALAPRAMLAGALACWTTGAVASVFI